jgi:predicted ester cyclase
MADYESLVEHLFRLWTKSPGDDPAAVVAEFRKLYTDPVRINGADMRVVEIAERAWTMHRAFEDLRVEVVEQVHAGDKVVVVFRQTGCHVGPLPTVLGEVPATGRQIEGLGIDVLTITDGRISQIWVLADELQRLVRMGAVTLVAPG